MAGGRRDRLMEIERQTQVAFMAQLSPKEREQVGRGIKTILRSRKRDHINLTTKLAAALACLLPQEWRDAVRAMRIAPETMISHFQFDHIVLHAPPFNGSDEWWNLDPKLIAAHKEKSAKDTSLIAKTKRLSAQHEETRRRILSVKKMPKKKRSRWPKRTLR